MDPDAREMLRAASRYSYLGIFFGVAIGIGYAIGAWMDARFHTTPWLTLGWLLIGIAAGFRELIRVARQGMPKDDPKDDPKDAGKE
jgi:ATP synthase protein I